MAVHEFGLWTFRLDFQLACAKERLRESAAGQGMRKKRAIPVKMPFR